MGREKSSVNRLPESLATDAGAKKTAGHSRPAGTNIPQPETGSIEPFNRIKPKAIQLQNANSDEIKRQIDETRSKMDVTLEQIEQRLRPSNLIGETLSFFHGGPAKPVSTDEVTEQFFDTATVATDAVTEFAQQVLERLKQNPIGSLLISSGIAYIAYASRQPKSGESLQPGGHARRPVGPSHSTNSHSTNRLMTDTPDAFDETELELIRNRDFDEAAAITVGPSIPGRIASIVDPNVSDDPSITTPYRENDPMSRTHDINRLAKQLDENGAKNGGAKHQESAETGFVESAVDAVKGVGRSAVLRGRATARDAKSALANAAPRTNNLGAESVKKCGQKFDQARNEYPLAVGLGFAAIGALAGLMIPRTQNEDRWMGEQSDAIKDQLRTSASSATKQAADRGRQALLDVKDTAMQGISEKGLEKSSLIERAKAVVQASLSDSQETLTQLAQREGLTPQQLISQAKQILSDTCDVANAHVAEAEESIETTVGEAAERANAKSDEIVNEIVSKSAELQRTAEETVENAKAHVTQAQKTSNQLHAAAMRGAATVAEANSSVSKSGDIKKDADLKVDDKSDALKIDADWSDHEKAAK